MVHCCTVKYVSWLLGKFLRFCWNLVLTNVWKITFRPFLLVHHPCSKLRTPQPIIFTHHKKSVREANKGQCSKLCTKVINTMYVQRKHAEKDWLVFPEALKPFCFIHFIETEPCFEKVTFFSYRLFWLTYPFHICLLSMFQSCVKMFLFCVCFISREGFSGAVFPGTEMCVTQGIGVYFVRIYYKT